jgi:hypothetical protein
MYLNAKLQERDVGRLPRAAAIRLDDYLDQWLATSAKPRLRPKRALNVELSNCAERSGAKIWTDVET